MYCRLAHFSALLFPVVAVAVTDPSTLCETRTATIAVPSYAHCKVDDLIEVEAHEVSRMCAMSGPIVQVRDRYLCAYRGDRRTIRERPLTEVEKQYDKEQLNLLLDKYRD